MVDIGLFEAGVIFGITVSAIIISKLSGLGFNFFQLKMKNGNGKHKQDPIVAHDLTETKSMVVGIKDRQIEQDTKTQACFKDMSEKQGTTNLLLTEIRDEMRKDG